MSKHTADGWRIGNGMGEGQDDREKKEERNEREKETLGRRLASNIWIT